MFGFNVGENRLLLGSGWGGTLVLNRLGTLFVGDPTQTGLNLRFARPFSHHLRKDWGPVVFENFIYFIAFLLDQ